MLMGLISLLGQPLCFYSTINCHRLSSHISISTLIILVLQGDKKSTQQVNYGKTTHFISKYSCWSLQGIRGDLDFSHADHFFTSTCAQWANFFFKGRKFEIDLRVKQKQIEFLFPVKST